MLAVAAHGDAWLTLAYLLCHGCSLVAPTPGHGFWPDSPLILILMVVDSSGAYFSTQFLIAFAKKIIVVEPSGASPGTPFLIALLTKNMVAQSCGASSGTPFLAGVPPKNHGCRVKWRQLGDAVFDRIPP